MDSIFKKSDTYTMNTYKRFKVAFERGRGMYLYSYDGRKYLDFLAGIAVNILGHSHDVVVSAIKEQSKKLLHVSNLYYIKEQADLAELLVKHSSCDRAFFCNSGAEANETALKIARKWGSDKGKYKILSFKNSFHGRTIATLALTGQTKYQEGFGPFPEGFDYVEFNNFEDFTKKVDDKTVAIFVEFVQGEGGINVAEKSFIEKVYEFCKANDMLFVVDEIQSGMGRTGRLFSYEHYDIEPDIITLAKGIAAGLPMGVVLAKEDVAGVMGFGSHGSTFGGNPFVSFVAYKVLNFVLNSGLIDHARQVGDYLLNGLKDATKDSDKVENVEGLGLMVGIKFKDKQMVDEIVNRAFENGILVGKAGERTVRLEPPLIVEKAHVDEVVDFFRRNL